MLFLVVGVCLLVWALIIGTNARNNRVYCCSLLLALSGGVVLNTQMVYWMLSRLLS